jgi:ElaB/YqjD/DUF883 family membrane-anchored ribosome-binding protein
MGERDDAKRSVESTRARIGVLAHEVSRRMTPGYAKERAREMARYKAYEMRDRAAQNPWILPMLGGGIGALIGKALAGRAQERRDRYWDDRYGMRGYRAGDGYGLRESERYEVWAGEDAGVAPVDETDDYTGIDVESSGGGMRDRVGEVKDRAGEVKDRALEMKDRASERVSEVKDRLTGTASGMKDRMRSRAYDLRDRIPGPDELRWRAQENPAFWAFGAMAVGALFGLVLPVTEREREALAPAKEKLREAGEQAAHKVSDKVSEKMGTTGASQGHQTGSSDLGIGSPAPMTPSSGAGTSGPDILSPDPLH